jgi:hypothetical protein
VRPAWLVAGAVVATLALLGGCGGDDGGGAPAARGSATRAPAVKSPAVLEGSWTRRFRPREVTTEGSPAGLYTLEIADGVARVYAGPDADPARDCLTQEWCFEITLEGRGRVLTVGETSLCPGTGRYAFTVRRDRLRTRKVEDDCVTGRPVLFDGRTWRRAG